MTVWEIIEKHAASEWRVLTEAPVAAVLLLLIAGVVVFFWQEHRYAGVRDRIEARDERIARLEADLKLRPEPQALKPAVSLIDESPGELFQPDGSPDTKLSKVCEYVLRGSYWASQHRPSGPEMLQEIRDKLHLRRLSAWGRREVGGSIERIPWQQWSKLSLVPSQAAAMSDSGQVAWHDVQFEMQQVWAIWVAARV
ncbi:hypothetical protein [Phenylobacterium sp.]|uniref:hypothetical protein n=1 Tax=Phenylobacterium sp. TaxID=1871053 RepID=UPI0037834067